MGLATIYNGGPNHNIIGLATKLRRNMIPEATIVYGIDLGQLDFDDIGNLENNVLGNYKRLELATYGDQEEGESYILAIKDKNLPAVICEAKSFDPLKLIIGPDWDVILKDALIDINKEIEASIKNNPKWYLIESYGG